MSRLLIVAPNWLGDAVMALPAIADVRRASPGWKISVSGPPAVASLFRLGPYVDEVIEKNAGVGDRAFDTVLLLPNSFRSALDAARARIRERWGYRADGRAWLLTRAVRRPTTLTHQIDYYRGLVEALGFPNGDAEPRIDVPIETRSAGADALREAGWDGTTPLVCLAPGAAFGAAKRWPPEYFADLIRGFAEDGIRSVVVGSAADQSTAREIDRALGDDRAAAIDLVGRTDVATLAGALTHVRALVANDSGALHLAAAIGVPVTGVFGPTDERLTAPRSKAPRAVLTNQVWCRPCMLRECPLDHGCLRGITVEDVAAATRRIW